MGVAIVTGSAGLIGSESVRFFARAGLDVIGIDNDMRKFFFGEEGSTAWNRRKLEQEVKGYVHHDTDIRDAGGMQRIFRQFGKAIRLIVLGLT